MGSQLEGFIAMMCVAVVGGIVAVVVHKTDSPICLAGFAFLGTHLLVAGLLLVPFAIICAASKLDPPPFAFLWSLLLLVVIPGMVSLAFTLNVYWPNPTSRHAIAMSWIGATASPFILLGVGGSAVETWVTRKNRDRTIR